MPNEFKTPEEVFGKGLMAEIADYFLIDEASDLLKFTPGGFAGGPGARGALGAAVRTKPGEGMRALSRARGAIDDMAALLKRLGGKPNALPQVENLDPRKAEHAREILMRRLTVDPTVSRNAGQAAGAAIAGSDAGQGAFASLLEQINQMIESERQRTGGQGLGNFFGTE